jgi:hypothetical protein
MRSTLKRRALGAAAAMALAAAASPVAAQAAGGKATLRLNGPAAADLRSQGVKIAPLGAAKGGPGRLVLPVRAGLAGERTTLLRGGGGIAFRSADGKSARLRDLSLVLGTSSRVGAKLGGGDLDLFSVPGGGKRKVDAVAGTASLAALKLQLTPAAARALATKLGLEKVQAGRFGVLAANASGLTAAGTEAAPGTPGSKGGTGPGSGGGSPAPLNTTCPLPSGAGPVPESPLPFLARPPAAVDITGATVDWQVRESFIRYIGTGEGTSVSGGAVADPAVLKPGASAALSYGFQFPFASGWLDRGADPASAADDVGLVKFGGAVRFSYKQHGIDLTTAEPELELNGASSRAIFAISENGGASSRQVLVNLDLSRAGGIKAAGNSYTYERVPGAVPAGTAGSTFAGFYSPGTDFGCFDVSFQTGG